MDNSKKAIGVFDSGLGGISVLRDLKKLMPNEDFIYFGDSAYAPYGIKTKDEITKRCVEIIDFFIEKGVKAVVIACNTATSASANYLRKKYKDLPIIGMEPALKVATQGVKNNNIVVMATPLTLKEKKFETLMHKFRGNNKVVKMPCPKLVEIVENDLLDDETTVINQLKDYYKNVNVDNLDSVVLGCTHFIFYKDYLNEFLPETAHLVDGNMGTCKHVKEILEQKHELNEENHVGNIEIYKSSDDQKYMTLSNKLLAR